MENFWSFLGWLSGLGLFVWIGNLSYEWIRVRIDSHRVQKWLKANTYDEPAETHKSLFEISDGTRLPEERVRIACLESPRIYQSLNKPGNYSIWRKEPQSVYEKRGILAVGDDFYLNANDNDDETC